MEIPSYIHEIKSINLTDAGRISLSPFSKKVIGMADKKTAAKKPTGNPFLYFVKVCNLVSRDLGEQPNWPIVTQLSIQMNVSPDSPKLENNEVNAIKGKEKTRGASAWRPAHEDPYYRTEKQQTHFEQQRAKREQEWAQRPPEEQERLHKKAAEFRALLGIDENGEQIAEPDKASGFLYHAAKKRWDEKQEPYTHDVPSWKAVPYIDEDGLWEEV